MVDLTLNEAAALQMQQTAQIVQIWTMFVTATFAAALLNASNTAVRVEISLAVTIGFLLFAYGHFTMLQDALKASHLLSVDLTNQLASSPSAYRRSLKAIASPAFKPEFSYAVHAIIDACVVASIWARHFRRRPPAAPPGQAAAETAPAANPPGQRAEA
jgi:hypothetical protein